MIKMIILGTLAVFTLIMTIALCQIAGDDVELPCGGMCKECPEKEKCPFSTIK